MIFDELMNPRELHILGVNHFEDFLCQQYLIWALEEMQKVSCKLKRKLLLDHSEQLQKVGMTAANSTMEFCTPIVVFKSIGIVRCRVVRTFQQGEVSSVRFRFFDSN